MKSLVLNDIEITLKKHKKARRLKMSVRPDGSTLITLPIWLPYILAENFAKANLPWLIRQRAKLADNQTDPQISTSEALRLKNNAKALLLPEISKYASSYGVQFQRVSIRNQRSRWGSCSRAGNLNFNWRILLFPENIRTYIIVHEVCHLRELNHARRFWELVALAVPEYKLCRKWLKQYGLGILNYQIPRV